MRESPTELRRRASVMREGSCSDQDEQFADFLDAYAHLLETAGKVVDTWNDSTDEIAAAVVDSRTRHGQLGKLEDSIHALDNLLAATEAVHVPADQGGTE